MDILAFIRNKLNNNTLRFKIEIIEKENIKKRSTPQEIYNNMLSNNPQLEQLVTNLNLEID